MNAVRRPRVSVLLVAALLAACASTQNTGPGNGQTPQVAPPPTASGPAVPPAPAPQAPNPVAEIPRSEWPPNYETLHIKVSGMTCPFKCVREVKEMLRAVPGVLHVTVDYDEREADVDVVPGTDPQSV